MIGDRSATQSRAPCAHGRGGAGGGGLWGGEAAERRELELELKPANGGAGREREGGARWGRVRGRGQGGGTALHLMARGARSASRGRDSRRRDAALYTAATWRQWPRRGRCPPRSAPLVGDSMMEKEMEKWKTRVRLQNYPF